jgi:hypothetical protein
MPLQDTELAGVLRPCAAHSAVSARHRPTLQRICGDGSTTSRFVMVYLAYFRYVSVAPLKGPSKGMSEVVGMQLHSQGYAHLLPGDSKVSDA